MVDSLPPAFPIPTSMDDPALTVHRISWVKPRILTPRISFFIPTVDTFAQHMYSNRRILFYDLPSSSFASTIDHLKTSLSDVLVDFYPAAGRLAVGEDGRIFIDCNDHGVEFVETAMYQVSIEDVARDNFQMKPLFNKLARWESNSPDQVYSMPLLSIQVTQFKSGGIALGVAHSHILADGHSLWHFMKSWAERGRGVPISMPPIINGRTVLKVDNPSEKVACLSFEDVEEVKREFGQLQTGQVMAQRVFHFSTDKIMRLKNEATNTMEKTEATKDGKGRYTTYEVLCAHIWRSVTTARGNIGTDKICFISAADFRSRLRPPLPDCYFGTAIMWGIAVTTAGELNNENLAGTATRMHEAVSSVNEATLQGMLHWLELHSVDSLVNRVKLNGLRMRVSSSPRFPIYEVDFGWAKPLAVRTAKVEEEGKIVLFPGREGDGSIEICMALPSDIMEKLEADPGFL